MILKLNIIYTLTLLIPLTMLRQVYRNTILSKYYCTQTQQYIQHIIPNPNGYEAAAIRPSLQDEQIKVSILESRITYQKEVMVKIPKDKQISILIFYEPITVLGMLHKSIYPPIYRKFTIRGDKINIAKDEDQLKTD